MRTVGGDDQGSGGTAPEATAVPRRGWPFDKPDFWRLWSIGLVGFAVRWLEMLVVGVFVYQHTGSPFLVALMTLLRLLPMALLGAGLGAVAERLERPTPLLISIATQVATPPGAAPLAHPRP